MRILILPYNMDYNCPCIRTVHVIQSCIIFITAACTMNQDIYLSMLQNINKR